MIDTGFGYKEMKGDENKEEEGVEWGRSEGDFRGKGWMKVA